MQPSFHLLKGVSHLFTFSLFHLFTFKGREPFFHLFTFSPFHLFTFSPFHPFTLSPFHPFTFTTMRWVNKKRISVTKMRLLVGILGLEPRMTGPESVVLPLHHIPLFHLLHQVNSRFACAKLVHFLKQSKLLSTFFPKKWRNQKIDFALWMISLKIVYLCP